MGLMNMGVLLIFWVWYGCVVNEFVDVGRGQSSNCTMRTFFLHSFPPDLGGKNWWAREENFLPSFPSSLFSFAFQTVKNTVFHTIFHPLFSILPIIPPTKPSVKLNKFRTLEYHVRYTAFTQPQSLTYLIFFFSLAFGFVSHSSRCGFLFFLSSVRVTRDGRPQLLTYLILFFSLFKHRQIVFSLAFSFVSYSSRCGFLFFSFFCQAHVGWEATIVD